MLAGGLVANHTAIPEGVYKIVDSVTKLPMCAYTDPSQGVGDYEVSCGAHLPPPAFGGSFSAVSTSFSAVKAPASSKF